MAQRSIENYFNIRKRPAQDELISNKIKRGNKQTFKNEEVAETCKSDGDPPAKSVTSNVKTKLTAKRILRPRGSSTVGDNNAPSENVSQLKNKPLVNDDNQVKSATDAQEISLNALKKKIGSSSRLAKLKASIARFQESDKQLQVCKTNQIKELLPDTASTVDKPKSVFVASKQDTSASTKSDSSTLPISLTKVPASEESLCLPVKYKLLATVFDAIDAVSQILYNRQEIIIFKKLKSGVEQMIKRNLTEKHLGQIRFLYPDAYSFHYDKLREYGTGTKRERWELVIKPVIEETNMTSNTTLTRRRKFHSILIERMKIYHKDFLKKLNPSLKLADAKIVRWHPQFNIEGVPDVQVAPLPECPHEEKLTTGSEVLEKAKEMFNCNTRMEQALVRLKKAQGTSEAPKEVVKENSALKGIPKALLEKVRQKQAAKALDSVTHSSAQEKEAQFYSQLPEIARFTKNLYVAERKAVLPLPVVLDKLGNSYRVFMPKSEMEKCLRTISKEVPEWLEFHDIRGSVFIKIVKNADITVITNKLTSIAESKKLC